MKLSLITVPDKVLRKKSQPVEVVDKKFVHFFQDLAETLIKKQNPGGVGLSAVQVGNLSRVFITNLPPVPNLDNYDDSLPAPELKFFINPEIVDASENLTFGSDPKHPALEGCLSIPSLYGPVLRHQTIKIKYQTLDDSHRHIFLATQGSERSRVEPKKDAERSINLIEKTEVFSNFYARVIQHEYDHLEGVLFTDYTLKDNQSLYFDQNDRLVEIAQPNELIHW